MLTAYNSTAITYDALGNPLSDGTWSYTWGAGRQLQQMSKTGTTVQFRCNHNGLRTQKIVMENGVTTTSNYMLHGKLITHLIQGSDSMHFFYDAQSRPLKVSFNGTLYTYLHNLQGDIVGILDGNGTLVVEYKYDAWGRKLSVTGSLAATLGTLSPFRYRGYVYDEETRLYYLRSRYYNPSWGRFINADDTQYVENGMMLNNVFAYCSNNPVVQVDMDGEMGGLAIGIFGVISAFAKAAATAIVATVTSIVASPVVAVIGGIIVAAAVVYTVIKVVEAVSQSRTVETTDTAAKTVSTSQTQTKKQRREGTVIYRYGGTNPGNLVPSSRDVAHGSGLSFSTVYKPGAAMTTIEALRASGYFCVVQDSKTHVTVYPLGGTVAQWRHEGTQSRWTQRLKSLVVKS